MNRRTFLTQCTLGTVGLSAVLQGCQPMGDTRSSALASEAQVQGAGMSTTNANLERPALDTAAPQIFETATFAMG